MANNVLASRATHSHQTNSTARLLTEATVQPIEKVFAMVKGDGKDSYSKNSGYQAIVNNLMQSVLSEGLHSITLPSQPAARPVVVADLGSSSGPNAVVNAARIVEKLKPRLPKGSEFQLYFNDLPSNDFNNLFQLLSSRADNFFVAGVPGSFFGRLFLRSSVHVFYSCLCLHWISKIPDAVLDKDSPAYNSSRCWILKASPAVAAAYQQQALLDLKNFLLARAAELVSGGLLFFSMVGRSTSEPNEPTGVHLHNFLVDLDDIWTDLIAEGLVTEEQRETFNIPCYHRSIEDLRESIEMCDSLFHVRRMQVHRMDLKAVDVFGTSEPMTLSEKMAGTTKAMLNSLLEAHIGQKASEVIWERHKKLVEKRIVDAGPQHFEIRNAICLVCLIRK